MRRATPRALLIHQPIADTVSVLQQAPGNTTTRAPDEVQWACDEGLSTVFLEFSSSPMTDVMILVGHRALLQVPDWYGQPWRRSSARRPYHELSAGLFIVVDRRARWWACVADGARTVTAGRSRAPRAGGAEGSLPARRQTSAETWSCTGPDIAVPAGGRSLTLQVSPPSGLRPARHIWFFSPEIRKRYVDTASSLGLLLRCTLRFGV